MLNHKKFLILIITVVTFLAFSNTLTNDFVFEDRSLTVDWLLLQDLKNIPLLLKGAIPEHHFINYRPLKHVLTAFYLPIFGQSPIGYHLLGVVFHILTTVLIFLIVEHITKNRFTSFAAAIFFGLHPIHTEAVDYISANLGHPGILFFWLSFYLYLKDRKKLSVILYFLAVLINEYALSLVLFIILYDIYFKKIAKNKYIPYLAVFITYFLIGKLTGNTGFIKGNYLANSFFHTMLVMPGIFLKYIFLLFFPVKLSLMHEIAPGYEVTGTPYSNFQAVLSKTIFDFDVVLSVAVLVSIMFFSIWLFKKNRLLSFSIFFFFIGLAPISYIVPVGPALAERYMYIPSFGFVLILGYLLNRLFCKKKALPKLAIILLMVISSTYFYLTFMRNFDWKDNKTLWFSVIRVNPGSLVARYNLSGLYSLEQNWDQVINQYQEILRIEPKFWESRFNLANTYWKLGNVDDATKEYKQVIQDNPNFIDAYINLARIYQLQGKEKDALALLAKALQINPADYKVLGNVKRDEAEVKLNQAYQIYLIELESQ